LGGFLGGHLAGRFGAKRIIAFSMLFSSPLLLGFLLLPEFLSVVSLVLAGLVLLSTMPINVVLAQELAPHRTSTVSALTMGFSWGFGGILFVPLTGVIAEHWGLDAAYLFLLVLPIAGYFLSLTIPSEIHGSAFSAASHSLAGEPRRAS
jgi:FSR family fosmidomycin resistance protein-like MFS transporter